MGQNEGEDTQPHLAITTMLLRTYSCNGHTASVEAINCQVNLRQEMVVAFQVCSGVSPKARSHLLGTAVEPV